MNMKLLALGAFATASISSAFATISVYDFEEFAPTSGASVTSLVSTKNTVTMTLTRSSGEGFDVADFTTFANAYPLSFQDRGINPFGVSSSGSFMIANFDKTLDYFEFEATDFGADSDTTFMVAYSGADLTGSIVATSSAFWGTQSSPNFIGTAAYDFSGLGIKSVAFGANGVSGDFKFDNSMYYDNIVVRTAPVVPEPTSMVALAIGGLGLIRRRRKA